MCDWWKDQSVLFWCELSAQPAVHTDRAVVLSCLPSTWWGDLSCYHGKKKSQFSFTASCMKREATMQLEGQCFGFSSDQEQIHREKCKDKVLDTAVKPPSLVRNRLKRWRGWKSWKRACSLWVHFTLLSQADISPGAQGSHLLSRCFLLTFSDLNICSCMQRNNNVL